MRGIVVAWLVALGGPPGWASAQARAEVPAPAPTPAPGSVVDRVVATVEGQVITLSELDFVARVALVQRGAQNAAFAPLDDEARRRALDLVIGQRLQLREADRLGIPEVSRADVVAAAKAFKDRFASRQAFERFLAQHEADENSLAAVLASGLRAERFLDSKLRLRAQPPELEVRRYYDEHQASLGGSFTEVRAFIRERLFRERYARLAQAELAQMRQGADVRLVAPFARAAASAPSEGAP